MLVLLPVIALLMVVSRKARAGFFRKLGFYSERFLNACAAPSEKPRIWIHAVSVGEFNAIKPLIPLLEAFSTVFLTCTTRTGYTLAKQTFPNLPITYFPYDLLPGIRRAFQVIRPDLVILTETELWPNLLWYAVGEFSLRKRPSIPVILINGRLSERSFRGYQRIGFLTKAMLSRLSHAYVQTHDDATRFEALGLPKERIHLSGNIKFDVARHTDEVQDAALRSLLGIHEGDTVLTFASTHQGEDERFIEAYLTLKHDFPELKMILAIRHPERMPEVRQLLSGRALLFSIRSHLTAESPNTHPVILLDSIGELPTVLHLSTVCVMGGSFIEHGGHNPLEALNARIPVIFGPHMFNFQALSKMIQEAHAGITVTDAEESLCNAVTELLTQPEVYSHMVDNGQRLLEVNRGVKEKLFRAIISHLPEAARSTIR